MIDFIRNVIDTMEASWEYYTNHDDPLWEHNGIL